MYLKNYYYKILLFNNNAHLKRCFNIFSLNIILISINHNTSLTLSFHQQHGHAAFKLKLCVTLLFEMVVLYRSSLLRRFLDKWPGKKTFGYYRFMPGFFFIGAVLEYAMINWESGQKKYNFCKYMK